MKKYTIYCTVAQTRKALELGAPILWFRNSYARKDVPSFQEPLNNGEWLLYVSPTAEQMLGWLEDQGFYIRLSSTSGSVEMDCKCIYERGGTNHKIAALAVIDAALEYLNNNQKK